MFNFEELKKMSKDDYKILIELRNYNSNGCKSIKFLVFT